MVRRKVFVAAIVAVTAVVAVNSISAYHLNWCDVTSGSIAPTSWVQTSFSYTDYSYWKRRLRKRLHRRTAQHVWNHVFQR